MEIPKQKVILGENLRRMVVYLVIMQGQSYAETQRSLQTLRLAKELTLFLCSTQLFIP